MQHWEYLYVETGWFGLGGTQLAARSVNAQELSDWKKIRCTPFSPNLVSMVGN